MLKIKIPPRSEPEKTDAVPLKQGTEDNAVTQFRDWWQEEFENPADFQREEVRITEDRSKIPFFTGMMSRPPKSENIRSSSLASSFRKTKLNRVV